MSQTERLYKLKGWLDAGQCLSKAALLEALDISPATLKRDFAHLRDRLNAPIVHDRERGGWRLDQKAAALGTQYELPGLWLTAEEIHALLTMQHLLAHLDAGGLLGPHIAPLVERFDKLLGVGLNASAEVVRRIGVQTVGARKVHLPHFQAVGTALLQRRRLVIDYHGRSRNERREREVSPQRLIHYRDNRYLDAWCHVKRGLRSFAVDAVQAARVLDRAAIDVPDGELDAVLGAGYGIFAGRKVQWATLRFTPERARWVAAETWHPKQRGRFEADGSYRLELPYADPRELVMDILRHVPEVEVVGPAGLREVVGEKLRMGWRRWAGGSRCEPGGWEDGPTKNHELGDGSMESSIRQAPIAHWRSSDNEEQPLEAHLAGVSRLSRAFAAKIGLQDAGDLIGALHDLGKYSKEFQDYLRSAVGLLDVDADDYVDAKGLKGKVDHSTAGAQYIWTKLADKGPKERIAAQVLALCIASHHSGLIDCIGGDASNFGQAVFPRRMSKAQDKSHLDEVLRVADKKLIARCDELLSNPNMSAAFLSLLKRIEQYNAEAFAKLTHHQFGLAVRLLFSCLIDADRIDSADFEHKRTRRFRPLGDYVPWPTLLARLETHLKAFKPRHPIDDLRNQISAQCLAAANRGGGVYTLTVPTGGGKTLASLRFALHHAEQRQLDRVIYVIPFTSIIDQNARDVRDILEPKDAPQDKGKVVLEHHASLTPEQQTWREKLLTENWDAPVVYTTMVQFLESLFGSGTRGARRMHQLANAVLVFDEIQTLPIKCVHLFNNAINFLAEQCNTTVLLCTATQPLLHEVAKDKGAIRLKPGHELMRDVPRLFDSLKRVDVRDGRKAGGWNYDEIASLALTELARTGSCLVIVNTKDAAKQVFQRCLQGLSVEIAFHLSTDMCPAHRKAVLGRKQDSDSKTVIGRLALGLPVLCVSTQLIEAGVDVDFGAVIRSLAGLDSIAQAAGRCNRNGRSVTGIVHVVDAADERVEKLIDIKIGREVTKRVLDDFKASPARYSNSLVSPEALRDYYNYFFFKRADMMAYPVGERQVGRNDSLLNLLGANDQASSEYGKQHKQKPDIFLRQAFMTAANIFETIDAPTQGVVVPYVEEGKSLIADLHAAFKLDAEFDLLRRAQQYSVNVFPQVFERLQAANALTVAEEGKLRIFCLDARYYSPTFGLTTEPVSLMENLNV